MRFLIPFLTANESVGVVVVLAESSFFWLLTILPFITIYSQSHLLVLVVKQESTGGSQAVVMNCMVVMKKTL
jgi:hypothetical protein